MSYPLPTLDEIRAVIEEALERKIAPLRRDLARLKERRASAESDVGHIDIAKLAARLNRGRSTIADWCRAGGFPPPHHCGQRRCWFLADVEAWEAERRNGRTS